MTCRVVAVMQPYFFPYAGYYRLLAAADSFVVFDDVQFPRRGRVHRCELSGAGESTRWLTLPLARQSRDTTIRELRFADDARRSFDERVARLTWLQHARGPLAERLRDYLAGPLDDPCEYVVAGIRLVAEALGLPARIVRSSELPIEPKDGRAERIIAIVRALGGSVYLNAPGGRTLYEAPIFERSGLELRFLTPYGGSQRSILTAVATAEIARLRADILGNLERAD